MSTSATQMTSVSTLLRMSTFVENKLGVYQ